MDRTVNEKFLILVDSQAAILAIQNNIVKSNTVLSYGFTSGNFKLSISVVISSVIINFIKNSHWWSSANVFS